MDEQLIKSKERVHTFGEVFTPSWVVKDMMDMVGDITYKLETTELEPSCGNGNFLVEMLGRKMDTVDKVYNVHKDLGTYSDDELSKEYIVNTFKSIGSIYGVDIQLDNIHEAIERLKDIVDERYKRVFKREIEENVRKSIEYILSTNIIWGNTLESVFLDKRKHKNDDKLRLTEWTVKDNWEIEFKEYMFTDLNGFAVSSKSGKLDEIWDMSKVKSGEVISDEIESNYF